MKISQKGIELIKEFEGCHLTAYQDPVGIWTIGIGITDADKAVTGTAIKEGLTIAQATADKWLAESLDKLYAPKVMKYDSKYHWNQNQFDALVSFAYNIGSIDQVTNEGKRTVQEVAAAILLYNKAGGKVLAGLQRRRKAEYDLFLTPIKKGYSGTLPKLPKRGYFKYGDGVCTLISWRDQVKLVQKAINWAMSGITVSGKKFVPLVIDGKYGKKTDKAVEDLQRKNGLPVNGCWGKKCMAAVKTMKK